MWFGNDALAPVNFCTYGYFHKKFNKKNLIFEANETENTFFFDFFFLLGFFILILTNVLNVHVNVVLLCNCVVYSMFIL